MSSVRLIAPAKIEDKQYSQQELVRFLSYLKDKNLVKPRTVNSWSSAVSNLLSDLSASEDNDVRMVDIDLAVHRAANKISPSSLRSYRTRTKRAIEEFIKWKNDPSNYRPPHLYKTKPGLIPKHSPKSDRVSAEISSDENSIQSENLSEASSHPFGLSLSYPLRPDFLAQIFIPRDLSQLEAKRLGAFILTLSSDYQPE